MGGKKRMNPRPASGSQLGSDAEYAFGSAGGIFDVNIFGRPYAATEAVGRVPWNSFEGFVRYLLQEEFSPELHHYHENQEREVQVGGATKKICPDFVITLPTTTADEVVCVADAKHHNILSKPTAEHVAGYGDALQPQHRTRIYVPQGCHIQSGALELEQQGRVDLIIVLHQTQAE